MSVENLGRRRLRRRFNDSFVRYRIESNREFRSNFTHRGGNNECTPPFVSLSSLYPPAWLCVSTQKPTTHRNHETRVRHEMYARRRLLYRTLTRIQRARGNERVVQDRTRDDTPVHDFQPVKREFEHLYHCGSMTSYEPQESCPPSHVRV